MAGEAKTSAFVLSSATVMIGAEADVLEFQPATHSIGLVKNFVLSADITYSELTQGTKNTIVFSVATQVQTRATMEVYEFTSKNVTYGLGLEGASIASVSTTHTLKTEIIGNDSIVAAVINTDVTATYPAGTWITIQGATGATADQVHLAKVASSAFDTPDTTLTLTGYPIPTGTTFAVGSIISKVNQINVGSKDEQPFLAAKVVGILPQDNKPIVLIIPKLRISKGFSLAFRTDNFGNMPYEFTPYDLVAADPHYSKWGGLGQAFIYTGV